ncbi:MAG TPA: DUF4870 domain-containing protein [Thermoanaerobaculia bacterium]|jgi:uncharacterized membrane protein|nr:DUF4870 domain-containing protein [Thermoanaerobaculia bacterium]
MSETPSSYTPPPPPPGGSYTPPPPPPPPGAAAPGGDRTIMIVLSYLWILALIPLLTKKDDPEVQWHAKNGLALLGAEIVCWIVFTILGIILSKIFSALSCGIGLVQCAVWIGFLVVRVMCIVKGTGGQRFRIPVVTDMAEKM